MNGTDIKQFREQFRILERHLGLLGKTNGGGCCKSITLAQCHALVEIGRVGKISLKDLSIILNLDTSTTSRTVDSLVKKEYVKRTSSSTDRRSIDISLTDLGNELFKNIEKTMEHQFSNIFKKIPSNKQKQVIETLDLLIDAFDNY